MSDNYHIFKSGTLFRKDNSLCLEDDSGEKHFIPIENVESIFTHGQVDVNTKLFNFLNQNNICVHIFGWNGRYSGSFHSERSCISGNTVINQVKHMRMMI